MNTEDDAAAGRPKAQQRSDARSAIAARMATTIEAAGPMRFISDLGVRLLAAELLLRDLEELGWKATQQAEATRDAALHGAWDEGYKAGATDLDYETKNPYPAATEEKP